MDKLLPADVNAERATLGSILLDRDAVIPIAPWLFAEYFYVDKHGAIFEAQLACYNRRIPPDLFNVTDELRRQERLDSIGGMSYLIELSNSVPTAVHVEYYARIVERTALMRRLIGAGGKIAALGFDETGTLEETLDKAESELFAVSQRRANEGFVHIGQVVDSFFDHISQMQEKGGELVGLKSGFNDFDKLTGGLQKSDLLILAARPAVGKTSLALNIAYHAALHEEATVAIFSLEMSRDQLMQRILATHTGVDMQKLRTGQIKDSDLQTITEALGVLSAMPIYIDDAPGATAMDVRSKCRRLQAETGIDLIIVDYLQLMQGSSKRDGNRVQEVSEISRGLKGLAREINVPVIALSQLSRAVESRTSHIPMLSDLRESGCLARETLIYLPDKGMYQRIDTLIGHKNFNVLALNIKTWKLEPRPVTNAFCTGTKSVYTLTTSLGRFIRATANHKFLTIDGWKRLDELTPGTRIALPRHLQPALGNAYCGTGLSKQHIGRERAERLVQFVHFQEIHSLAQSDVYWDTLDSVVLDGEESVYDLTVDGLHNFVANDIIVHNSIEQDADIVMFIHREELYDPDTDKKGIAELHIAKHRNGPTGIVPLRFFKSTTRFMNLETYRQPEGY